MRMTQNAIESLADGYEDELLGLANEATDYTIPMLLTDRFFEIEGTLEKAQLRGWIDRETRDKVTARLEATVERLLERWEEE